MMWPYLFVIAIASLLSTIGLMAWLCCLMRESVAWQSQMDAALDLELLAMRTGHQPVPPDSYRGR